MKISIKINKIFIT